MTRGSKTENRGEGRTAENSVGTDGITPGYEDKPAPGPLKENGQYSSYWVLSEAERAKGFVRPVRRSYKHVGPPGPKHPLRDLTEEEKERYKSYSYVKYEEYPAPQQTDGSSEHPAGSLVGRYWTQAQLDKANKGCGSYTSMSLAIAETYARDPHYYGSTFCMTCQNHLSVGAQGEFVWMDGMKQTEERVGT